LKPVETLTTVLMIVWVLGACSKKVLVLSLFLCLKESLCSDWLLSCELQVTTQNLGCSNNVFFCLYLIFVDCLLLFFLWVVSTCVLICLVLLMDGFPSLIFIYRVLLLKTFKLWFIRNLLGSTKYHCELSLAQRFHNPLKIS
jgi:hypothetical protein